MHFEVAPQMMRSNLTHLYIYWTKTPTTTHNIRKPSSSSSSFNLCSSCWRFRSGFIASAFAPRLSQSSSSLLQSVVKGYITMSEAPAPIGCSTNKEVEEEEQTENGEKKKKKRKLTSTVWDDLTRGTFNGVQKAKCNHCGTLLSLTDTAATTHLRRHLKTCAAFAATKSGNQGKHGPTQALLTLSGDGSGLSNFKYEKEKVKDVMTKMIMVHEYPFMMAEHEFFILYSKTLNPRYEPISRRVVREHCLDVYKAEKKKLQSLFASVGRVSLTSDLWTSNKSVGFMCLTGHYVDLEWKLHSRLLNFCRLAPPHTGVAISDKIFDCLKEWGLQDKISTITLDNASSNDAAARCLKDELRMRGALYFNGKIFHLRCCAHILNLLVQDGLGVITEIIQMVRESVKHVTLTPSRLHKFNEIVKQISLKTNASLILDVPTRWNSTHYMLKRALIFKDVFPLYQKRDDSYRWLPSDCDWDRASKICNFLEVFDNVTKLFSGVRYPTSNLFFSEVWKIRKLLDEMSSSPENYLVVMVQKMKDKFDKYWGEVNLLMAIGCALDPRNKMMFVKFVFEKLYPPIEGKPNPLYEKKIDEVNDALYDLYSDYASRASKNMCLGENSSLGDGENENINEKTSRDEFEEWASQMNTIQPSKNEMDIYLEETFFKGVDDNFNVLDWWKSNTLKFPILSSMARDILSIPITTVASESAFSAGRRVLDDYRSSMNFETIEALLCTGNWLRHEYKIRTFSKEEDD